MTPPEIPEAFARAMREVHGEAGADWLARLPGLVERCAARWSLRVGPPFVPLSYNYAAPAVTANGTPVALKIGVPTRELLAEMDALTLFGERGIARLLDSDREAGALLLERLEPGESLAVLAETDDDRATIIAASVMRSLWQPAPESHAFPTVANWARGLSRLRERFAGGTGPLPRDLVERAEGLFTELLAFEESPVLLHGDCHHLNILSARRAPWLAIDPKGVIGDPAFEVAAFLRNPPGFVLRQRDPARILARRLDALSEELAIDRARLHGWALAFALLSAWWTVEDNGHGWEPEVEYARILAGLA